LLFSTVYYFYQMSGE